MNMPAAQHYAPSPAADGLALVESWHRRVGQACNILGCVVQEMDRRVRDKFADSDYGTAYVEDASNKINGTIDNFGDLDLALKALKREMNRIQDGE